MDTGIKEFITFLEPSMSPIPESVRMFTLFYYTYINVENKYILILEFINFISKINITLLKYISIWITGI